MNWLANIGEKYLGWTRYTQFGKAIQEWSEIFRPMYTDFEQMGYSEETVRELDEAWGTIPPDIQFKILKVLKLLKKWFGTKLATDLAKILIEKLKIV